MKRCQVMASRFVRFLHRWDCGSALPFPRVQRSARTWLTSWIDVRRSCSLPRHSWWLHSDSYDFVGASECGGCKVSQLELTMAMRRPGRKALRNCLQVIRARVDVMEVLMIRTTLIFSRQARASSGAPSIGPHWPGAHAFGVF